MAYILATVFNYIFGFISLLPTSEIQVDLTVFTDYLSFINYFIPFYLIWPTFMYWLEFVTAMALCTSFFGFIKRHL